MIEPKKNRLWIFDDRERKRIFQETGDKIRIIQVFQNPDSFGYGQFSIEEIAAVGKIFMYVVFGIDQRDGSRAKCVKYAVIKKGATEDEITKDLQKAKT